MLDKFSGLELVTVLSWSEFDPDENAWVRCHAAFDDSEIGTINCEIQYRKLERDPNVKDLDVTRIPKV